jgi:hypothetical protein
VALRSPGGSGYYLADLRVYWLRPARSAFAHELKADVPKIVTAVHVAGVCLGKIFRRVAHAYLLHDDVGAVVVAGDEQPGVIGAQLIGGAVPADALVRDVLGDRAGDR